MYKFGFSLVLGFAGNYRRYFPVFGLTKNRGDATGFFRKFQIIFKMNLK
ncbi:putative basic proline-rich protein-like [Iris pallida]|uniref:Basic proline-rich protein-like n=1 Tax=Iris pallida TaxID=29817 RepID=A0AAX6HAU7_IRIPA|nr:putative basic proline-rich protein-like [Iris pallida]